ncbi:MAG TPA: hypothetical protein VME69_13080 [Methylocella sp.]|nr:hypothetical protein [Methylocella sp.]
MLGFAGKDRRSKGAAELDGWTIALERIAREAEAKTGVLDLGRLGLSALPDELFQLKHLRRLNLGANYFDEEGQWQDSEKLANLQNLTCSGTQVRDLAPLEKLANPQSLTCSGTQVCDLAPLEKLAHLQRTKAQISGSIGP